MHNSNQQNHEHYPEEIDLVDVAAVVYRRKATLVLVVLCSVIASFGIWLLSGKKSVSAVFKIGEEANLREGEPNMWPLMSAPDSAQLLKMVYLPTLLNSTELETGTQIDKEDIEINYADSEKDSVKTTSILELFAEASQKDVQALVTIFDGSLNLLLKNHTEKLNEYKSSVNSLIETQKSNLLLLKQLSTTENPNAGLSQTSLVEANIMSLESTLAASTNSVVIKSASVEQMDSKGAVIYVAGGVVSGLFLGCFLIFFLELYAKAKIRAAETA